MSVIIAMNNMINLPDAPCLVLRPEDRELYHRTPTHLRSETAVPVKSIFDNTMNVIRPRFAESSGVLAY